MRNQIDDIRREKNMYYQIHTDLKQELTHKKEELVILIDESQKARNEILDQKK